MDHKDSRFKNEDLDPDFSEREAFRMCKRKIKFKSSKAGKHAFRHKQRKYKCDVCGHWHLTKQGGK